MKNMLVRRLGVLGASGALIASGLGLAGPAGSAHAAADPTPLHAHTQWLLSQLGADSLLTLDSGFGPSVSPGSTIDVGLVLDAVGAEPARVESLRDSLASHVEGYTSGEEYDYEEAPPVFVQDGYYANATAKALTAATVFGADPENYGGVDLVAQLESLVADSGPATGRIVDDSTFGDYVNGLGQGFAVRGLHAVDSSAAGAVTDYLIGMQCADGGFAMVYPAPDATEHACEGAGSADATGVALQGLLSIDEPSEGVTDSIAAARQFLLSTQGADGGFGGSGDTAATNANSTGLAGWALGELGETAAAEKAAAWLRARQVIGVPQCDGKVATHTGAIALDDEALRQGIADGIDDLVDRTQWSLVAVQALPALRWAPAASAARSLTGPAKLKKTGSRAVVTVNGLASGERGCVWGVGMDPVHVTGAAGAVRTQVTLADVKGNKTRTLVAAGLHGNRATTTVTLLGEKKLKFKRKAKARRGGVQRILVGGLVPGERVKVKIRKKTKTGKANAKGRFRTKFRVRGKVGVATIKVRGQFPGIRKNDKKFRVLRKKR